jgi:hypothetical protein
MTALESIKFSKDFYNFMNKWEKTHYLQFHYLKNLLKIIDNNFNILKINIKISDKITKPSITLLKK